MPCLANTCGKAVELFSSTLLTEKKCSDMLVSLLFVHANLLRDFPEAAPACIDMMRRCFLFLPESIFGINQSIALNDCVRLCEFALNAVVQEEKETAREGCCLLVDMISRTRKQASSSTTPAESTRWTSFGPILDGIILHTGSVQRLCDHLSQSLLAGERSLVVENLADLLYSVLRAYPLIHVQSWNGQMEQCARVASKEGFKRFIVERVPMHHT